MKKLQALTLVNKKKSSLLTRVAIVSLLARQTLLFMWPALSAGNIFRSQGSSVYFLAGAVGYGALYIVLKSEVRGLPGHLGALLLLLSALGMLLATVFPSGHGVTLFDNWQGGVHHTGEIAGLIAIPLAGMLVNLSLALRNPKWGKSDDILLWTSFTPIIGTGIFTGYMFLNVFSKGQHVNVGVLNHFFSGRACFPVVRRMGCCCCITVFQENLN